MYWSIRSRGLPLPFCLVLVAGGWSFPSSSAGRADEKYTSGLRKGAQIKTADARPQGAGDRCRREAGLV